MLIKDELRPFAHMAVAELVHALAFCRKSNKKPIASSDFQAFEPIPLALMAYASVAVYLVTFSTDSF